MLSVNPHLEFHGSGPKGQIIIEPTFFPNFSPDTCHFWVGKQSLKKWKGMAKEELDDQIIADSKRFAEGRRKTDEDADSSEPPKPKSNGVISSNDEKSRSKRKKAFLEEEVTVVDSSW